MPDPIDPVATLADPRATTGDLLSALAAVRRRRRELDDAERGLIERARENGLPWPRIAEALGLASRQAAEQRLLRLSAADGRDPGAARRQRTADVSAGGPIQRLRSAVRLAARHLLADPDWDRRHVRAALVRASIEEAAAAPPGALFSLVEAALVDLGPIPPAELPATVRPAIDGLRRAWADARPS